MGNYCFPDRDSLPPRAGRAERFGGLRRWAPALRRSGWREGRRVGLAYVLLRRSSCPPS